jgi:hypothetical protein
MHVVCIGQFDRQIGCRSLTIHRVEIISVVGGKFIRGHRAASNLLIASKQTLIPEN